MTTAILMNIPLSIVIIVGVVDVSIRRKLKKKSFGLVVTNVIYGIVVLVNVWTHLHVQILMFVVSAVSSIAIIVCLAKIQYNTIN